MRVLFVTSEAYPLAKSGGLADVSGALPAALIRQGIDVRLLLPGYPTALRALKGARGDMQLEPLLGIEDRHWFLGDFRIRMCRCGLSTHHRSFRGLAVSIRTKAAAIGPIMRNDLLSWPTWLIKLRAG